MRSDDPPIFANSRGLQPPTWNLTRKLQLKASSGKTPALLIWIPTGNMGIMGLSHAELCAASKSMCYYDIV